MADSQELLRRLLQGLQNLITGVEESSGHHHGGQNDPHSQNQEGRSSADGNIVSRSGMRGDGASTSVETPSGITRCNAEDIKNLVGPLFEKALKQLKIDLAEEITKCHTEGRKGKK